MSDQSTDSSSNLDDALIQKIAHMCHEVNRAYCEALKDYSQTSWENAPEWQKESALKGVQHVIENPHAAPSDMHNSWMRVKIEDGWVYGEEKNMEMKTHPCIIPYENLPVTQQAKDYVFLSIVKTMKRMFEDDLMIAEKSE